MKDVRRFLLTVAMAVVLSAPALAEERGEVRGGPVSGAERMHRERPERSMDKPPNQERFAEHKAMAVKRISGRIAEMEKKKACVEGASSPEAMGACFPNKGKRMAHHKEGGDGGPPEAEGQKE